ncbi:MAG: alpha/beta hydrolase [Pseudomonadota bacterium]
MAGFEWKPGETGFVAVGDMSLEATCFGPPPNNAPTIVLLHEGLGCVALWRDFPQRLSAETGYGVFAYSRAGYGQSSPCTLPRPLDYMTREALDVLPQVLNGIGFQNGILLGHSDGATIAAIHAGLSGDMHVRGAVLIAPHFFTEPVGLKSIAAARVQFETGDLREKLARYHSDVECAFRGWNDAWLDPQFVEWNVADAIDHLRVPVLAMQGRDDAYGTLAQIEEIETRSYAPVDVEILENCGHGPHIEKPDTTLHLVAEFAARLDRIERQDTATLALEP